MSQTFSIDTPFLFNLASAHLDPNHLLYLHPVFLFDLSDLGYSHMACVSEDPIFLSPAAARRMWAFAGPCPVTTSSPPSWTTESMVLICVSAPRPPCLCTSLTLPGHPSSYKPEGPGQKAKLSARESSWSQAGLRRGLCRLGLRLGPPICTSY